MSVSKKNIKRYMDLILGGVGDVIQSPDVHEDYITLYEGLSAAADAVGAEIETCPYGGTRYKYKSYFRYGGKVWFQVGKTPEESRE